LRTAFLYRPIGRYEGNSKQLNAARQLTIEADFGRRTFRRLAYIVPSTLSERKESMRARAEWR